MNSISKNFVSYVRLAGAALCATLLLVACSKGESPNTEPEPAEKPQLLLAVSPSEITEGGEVEFIVTIDITIVPADIYASAIAIVGKNVYIAGGVPNGTEHVATYWKNGKRTNLI